MVPRPENLFQSDAKNHNGFNSSAFWLRQNAKQDDINVIDQVQNPTSVSDLDRLIRREGDRNAVIFLRDRIPFASAHRVRYRRVGVARNRVSVR
jgi:hypothetical protein